MVLVNMEIDNCQAANIDLISKKQAKKRIIFIKLVK